MPRVKKDRFRRQEVQEAMESVQDAVDELEVMVQSPFGELSFGGEDRATSKFGDIIPVDPTQKSAADPYIVALPSLDDSKKNLIVTVVNVTSSTNNINIAAAEGDTINGATFIPMTTGWARMTCICVGPHSWVAS